MKHFLLLILTFISTSVAAYTIPESTGAHKCPIPDCQFTISSGMLTKTFDLWGNVKIVSDPSKADVCLFVTDKSKADLIVTYTDTPTGCGQWHIVESGEDFSVCFLSTIDFADFTICFGNAAEEYKHSLPY